MSRTASLHTVGTSILVDGRGVETYVVLRRSGWSNVNALRATVERLLAESERTLDDMGCIRSYVLAEGDGSLGAAFVFEASSPEAVRRHAAAAGLPVDEIVKVADTVVLRQDPVPAQTLQGGET